MRSNVCAFIRVSRCRSEEWVEDRQVGKFLDLVLVLCPASTLPHIGEKWSRIYCLPISHLIADSSSLIPGRDL